MSFQNQKTVLEINKLTSLNDDCSERESRIRNNQKLADYRIYNVQSMNRANYIDSTNRVGIYQNNNRDGRGLLIDNESGLLNGKNGNILTSHKKKTGKNLPTRLFPGVPFMGAGQSTLKNPDLKSELLSGEQTSSSRSCGSFAGVNINRFIPLLPCLEETVQNVSHIVPTHWVRGGESTRNIVRNIDYLKNCSQLRR